MTKFKAHAIALMSGGLDSTLAARIIMDQGVRVTGLHLASPFGCLNDVRKNAQTVGVPLIVQDKGEAYLDLVKDPKYGYGRNLNPCVDCRIYMFQLAEKVRIEQRADFIITGEVLGQRHMSQLRNSIQLIDSKSEMGGRVLRPLSAKLFTPTLAEEQGWVDREALLRLSGRSRKPQLALAQKLGIKEYEAPGGGCLLTTEGFSKRLKDYYDHDDPKSGPTRLARAGLLRFGRHFRLEKGVRLIVSRNEQENKVLEAGWEQAQASFFKARGFGGPSAVAFGPISRVQAGLIGKVLVRYGNVGEIGVKEVQFCSDGASSMLKVTEAASDKQLEKMRI